MLIFQDNCFRADVGGGDMSTTSLDQEAGLKGRLKIRGVQISFERCLGSATTFSLQRPSPCCHPERSRGTCGAPEPQTKALRVNSRIYPKRFVPHPPDRSLETTSYSTGLLLAPTPGVASCGQPRSQATKVLGKTCELTRGGFCLGFRRTADPSAALGMTTRRGSLQGEGGC